MKKFLFLILVLNTTLTFASTVTYDCVMENVKFKVVDEASSVYALGGKSNEKLNLVDCEKANKNWHFEYLGFAENQRCFTNDSGAIIEIDGAIEYRYSDPEYPELVLTIVCGTNVK